MDMPDVPQAEDPFRSVSSTDMPAWSPANFDFAPSPESMIPTTPSSDGWSGALTQDPAYPLDLGDLEQNEEIFSSSAIQPMDNTSVLSLVFKNGHPCPAQWD